MKKIFSICSAIAVVLTGLTCMTSCGGGGGDNNNKSFVTAQDFRSGAGFLLLGNPRFRIEAGYSEEVEGYNPSTGDGLTSGLLPIPGTGQEAKPDYDLSDGDDSQPEIAPEYLNAVGSTTTAYRRVGIDYTTNIGNCVIQYTMTKQNIGVAVISLPGGSIYLESDDVLSSLGAYPGQQNDDNDGGNEDNTNRGAIASLAATQIEIHFDFNTGMATTYITATNVRTNSGNTLDFTATPTVLSASAVPFRTL